MGHSLQDAAKQLGVTILNRGQRVPLRQAFMHCLSLALGMVRASRVPIIGDLCGGQLTVIDG